MTRWIPAAAIVVFVLGVPTTYAQSVIRPVGHTFPAGAIEGRVLDEQQAPVFGAMVSVIGRTTAVATTDRDGRYSLRELPFGPYILSVHSRGYWQSRGRTIQLTKARFSLPEIQLTRATTRKAATGTVAAMLSPAAARPATQLAGFGLDASGTTAPAAIAPQRREDEPGVDDTGIDAGSDADTDVGETAWRLRHLPRSILKDAAFDAVWRENREADTFAWFERSAAGAMVPLALFAELPLSGQVNLLTSESFYNPGDLARTHTPRSVAYVSVNTEAAGGAWAVRGAMTQGDLSSWIVAGSYKSIESAMHAYELGLSYSTQRYDGGNAAALGAIRENARNVGMVYGYDEWTLSPRLLVGYGTAFARYDYLSGSGLWSPRLSVTVPLRALRLKALATRRAVVPGAEEFAPSVTGLWLPPERTFSSLASDGRFTPEQTNHLQVSVERDLAAGVTVSLRGFSQQVDDQLIEMFDVNLPGHSETPMGHYFVGTAGDMDARGWGIGMTHEVPGYVRGSIQYTVTSANWAPSADNSFARTVRAALTGPNDRIYDLQTSVEATIPRTSTRVFAKYRVNTAFWSGDAEALPRPSSNGRFNVRVHQSLPFLRFSNADWEALLDLRNTFREAESEASVYDEALAIHAPKRIVGGLQVKF
jgi:Carboxypeptidase regulatory-like domain